MSNFNHNRKNPKPKNENLVKDQRWKTKGGPHKQKMPEPIPCPDCLGIPGYVEKCNKCDGVGELEE